MHSKMQSRTDECFCCGRTQGLQWHHVIHGRGRRTKGEKYGLVIRLCWNCHQGTRGVHGMYGHELNESLKRTAQSIFELDHTREEFINEFGRSYL